MDNIDTTNKQTEFPWAIVVAILIGAWLIGVSILGAGWMVAKEVSNQANLSAGDINIPQKPININVPNQLPVEGDTNAKVTVIEFADFQCPFCGEWHKDVYPKLKSEYIDTGKIKFVFWPIAFLGEESNRAAEASFCAKENQKFWQYHDTIYNNQNGENEGAFTDDKLSLLASEVGLDLESFNNCFKSRIYKPDIEDLTNNSVQYGVTSTPTVFINGLKFEGVMPWENYKQIIETELAK